MIVRDTVLDYADRHLRRSDIELMVEFYAKAKLPN